MDATLRIIRNLTRALVVLLVLGVIANDGIRTVSALGQAGDGMKAAMAASIDAVRANPTVSAEPLAAAAAQSLGTTLESYEQAQAQQAASLAVGITVRVSAPLARTVIVGPAYRVINGAPLGDAYNPEGAKLTLTSHKVVTEIGTAP